jgi:hypothetical protein
MPEKELNLKQKFHRLYAAGFVCDHDWNDERRIESRWNIAQTVPQKGAKDVIAERLDSK